jgi:hypothetical protein
MHDQSADWRTAEGVSIGTSLRELEQLNAHTFHLAGFGTDAPSAVTSWDGGRLSSYAGPPCRLLVRLDSLPRLSSTQRELYDQVIGDGYFSSANPTMQTLDPRVSELLLEFH